MVNAARERRSRDLTDSVGVEGSSASGDDGGGSAWDDGSPVLDIAELMFDENGEAVLYNDSNLRLLTLTGEARVTDEGEVGAHVTAAGDDVTGFHFLAFDSGVRLFYQPGLEVIVTGRHG